MLGGHGGLRVTKLTQRGKRVRSKLSYMSSRSRKDLWGRCFNKTTSDNDYMFVLYRLTKSDVFPYFCLIFRRTSRGDEREAGTSATYGKVCKCPSRCRYDFTY